MSSLEVLWKALLLFPRAECLRAEAQSLARAHPQQQAAKPAPASSSSQLFTEQNFMGAESPNPFPFIQGKSVCVGTGKHGAQQHEYVPAK